MRNASSISSSASVRNILGSALKGIISKESESRNNEEESKVETPTNQE